MQTLPRGPKSALFETLRFALDPFGALSGYAERYGDVFTLPTFLGPSVITGDPEGVREIFAADPDLFEAWAKKVIVPVTGENTMVLLEGARHKRERKLLMPPFHGARMRAYGSLIQDATRKHTAALGPGRRFVAQDITTGISLEVIFRAVLGLTSEDRMRELSVALERAHRALNPLFLLVPALQRDLGGRGPWASYRRARGEVYRLFLEEISAHREAPSGREDILSLMLEARDEEGRGMSDEEIQDELTVLLFAGHETTAVSLAWALYFVHRDHRIARRLDEELSPLGPSPAPDDLARLPYLGAVCDEALRIRPVIPIVYRRLKRPWRLLGRDLHAGMGVAAAAGITHFNEALYPDPRRFSPERFIERKFTPFEYYPFGGGVRRCLGAAFALYEMKIVLGTLLAGHRLALIRDDLPAPVNRGIAVGPKGGVEMRCLDRRPAAS